MIKSDVQSVRLSHTLSPMADCYVNNTLIKAAPFMNQSFFQVVCVTVHSLLQNAADRVVDRIGGQ